MILQICMYKENIKCISDRIRGSASLSLFPPYSLIYGNNFDFNALQPLIMTFFCTGKHKQFFFQITFFSQHLIWRTKYA
jgi:hypothetical protein